MPFHKLFLVFFLSRISAEERRSGYEDVNFGRGHGNFMIGRSFVDTVSGFKITCNSLDQTEYPLSSTLQPLALETSPALETVNEQSEKLLAQTANESSLPHMELADSSRLSTPPETEPVMDCSLVLTTLSGVTIKVSLSVAKFDRFEDLEDQVMGYLVSVTDLKVFGCSIDFLQTATQTYLEDPIWDKLQQSMEYTIVFRDSSVVLPSQEQLEGCPIYHVPLRLLFMSP